MGHYDAITINTDDISTTHHGSEMSRPHIPVRMEQEPSTAYTYDVVNSV